LNQNEKYEQLLENFTKKRTELKARLLELENINIEYGRTIEELDRLSGCIETVEYLLHGTLPPDGIDE